MIIMRQVICYNVILDEPECVLDCQTGIRIMINLRRGRQRSVFFVVVVNMNL